MTATATILATALAFSPVNTVPPPTYLLGGTIITGSGAVTEGDINWLLNGNLTGAQNVPYPRALFGMDASIGVGADAIVDILDTADEPVRIAGVSQGAMAISEAKRRLMALDEEDRPEADDVVFVAIGDPSSATGIGGRLPGLHVPFIGVTFRPAPETPYDTIVVTREYDGLADFPDRPLNLFATANALAGVAYVHIGSYGPDTDLDAFPAGDVTEAVNDLGGKTTTYFIQNDRLPLLQPLRDLSVDERLVDAIETPLKQIVDAGYSRNDPKPDFRDDDVETTADSDVAADSQTVRAKNHADRKDADRQTGDQKSERKSPKPSAEKQSKRSRADSEQAA